MNKETIHNNLSVQEGLLMIQRNTETIIGLPELKTHLSGSRPLRVKLGVDPTRPDLTFGHLVVLNKLRQFQDLGHEAILIIGDFTAMIGDPSGRSATRPPLTRDEVRQNAETYLDQAFMVLDKSRTCVRYNSEWFSKMGFEDCLNLARQMTVARMLERDDFSKRYADNTPISIIEFLYPLIQGQDSIEIHADVEIGGTDQLFNMLVGRKLQEDAGMSPQSVITMPLLVGLDGVKKMSKSLDNYIAFTDSAKEMFGKIMSISDPVMWDYYKLLVEVDESTLDPLRKGHPMEAKKQLATTLVARFHSEAASAHELEQFEKVFSKHQVPDEMPSFTWEALIAKSKEPSLLNMITATELFSSKSEVRRLIQQGAVKINRNRQTDPHFKLGPPREDTVIQAGKRTFFKIQGLTCP